MSDKFVIDAGHNQFDNVKQYVQNGGDINYQDGYGDTALMYSAENGNIDIVNYLNNNRADKELKNNMGVTAVMFSAFSGNYDVFKSMLDAKPELKNRNDNGEDLFHFACMGGNVKIMQDVLALSDKDGKKIFGIFTLNNKGENSLMIASKYGRVGAVAFLLDSGLGIKCVDKDGKNAFDKACDVKNNVPKNRGQIEVMKLLAVRGIFAKAEPFKLRTIFKNIGREKY